MSRKKCSCASRSNAPRDQTNMTSNSIMVRVTPAFFRRGRAGRRRLALLSVALSLTLAGSANAQLSESASPKPSQEATLSPQQQRALQPLSWKKAPGQGLSFGLEEGLWGDSWSQGLRITLPFNAHFGTTLRGIYLIDMANGTFTADAGARLDFVGRSDVLFNVLRLYGGGGVQVLAPAANTDGRQVRVGGGGHFGFEFFCNPHYSFFLEVGGQGGPPSPGATVQAGMMFYPWTR